MLSGLAPLWRRLLVDPWQRVDREQRDYLNSAPPGLDSKVISVLIVAAFVLTLQHYLLINPGYSALVATLHYLSLDGPAQWLIDFMQDPESAQINGLTYWAVGNIVLYVVPASVVIALHRESPAQYGLKLRGAFTDWWAYLLMYSIVFCAVLVVSQQEHFQATYPFYRLEPYERLWPNFWRWEFAYFLQFLALEFFFRGFMVHGTRHRFGAYSIFVMTVPYCMIHFGKPFLETLGAIVAGVVLGFMSLKNRSIWMGGALHMGVALTMDFVSMWRQRLFP